MRFSERVWDIFLSRFSEAECGAADERVFECEFAWGCAARKETVMSVTSLKRGEIVAFAGTRDPAREDVTGIRLACGW